MVTIQVVYHIGVYKILSYFSRIKITLMCMSQRSTVQFSIHYTKTLITECHV